MNTKLIQKSLLKGSREFEIADDFILVKRKSFMKDEMSTVNLSTLNPVPVLKGSELMFLSQINDEVMLSLLVNKPGKEEFSSFVEFLKQQIQYDDSQNNDDIVQDEQALEREEALKHNFYEEPPEFANPETDDVPEFEPVNPVRVGEDIEMLKAYVDENEISALLSALNELKADPENEESFMNVVNEFNQLGFTQGAVLNYANYLKVLLPKYIW